MVGKSICGSGETGSNINASPPASAMAAVSSVVATGRWMNGEEKFISSTGVAWHALLSGGGRLSLSGQTGPRKDR